MLINAMMLIITKFSKKFASYLFNFKASKKQQRELNICVSVIANCKYTITIRMHALTS